MLTTIDVMIYVLTMLATISLIGYTHGRYAGSVGHTPMEGVIAALCIALTVGFVVAGLETIAVALAGMSVAGVAALFLRESITYGRKQSIVGRIVIPPKTEEKDGGST